MDFILEQDGALVAVEIKAGVHSGVGDTHGITAFREALGRRGRSVRGVVLHAGEARQWAKISSPCVRLDDAGRHKENGLNFLAGATESR